MKQCWLIITLFLSTQSFCQTAEHHYQNAMQLQEKKDFTSSLQAIGKALELDSNNHFYIDALARILVDLEKYNQAFSVYNRAIEKFPKESFLHNSRGLLLLRFSEFDLAILDFSKAIAFAKNDTIKFVSTNNRAAAKLSKRDFEGAYEDLIACYSFDSTNTGTLTNLGAVCDDVGRGDQTLKYLLKAVAIDSTDFAAYGNIGFKYQELGDHKKAIEYYNKVLALKPEEPLGFSNRSFNKLKLGDLKGAMQDIQRSIALYPANSYAYRIRALIYLEMKQNKMACDDFKTALDKGFTVTYGNEVIDLIKKHCQTIQ